MNAGPQRPPSGCMSESNATFQILIAVVLVYPRYIPPVYRADKKDLLDHLEEPDVQRVKEDEEVGHGKEGGENGEKQWEVVKHYRNVEEVGEELAERGISLTSLKKSKG